MCQKEPQQLLKLSLSWGTRGGSSHTAHPVVQQSPCSERAGQCCYVRKTLRVPEWFLWSEESANVLCGRLYNLVYCIWTLGWNSIWSNWTTLRNQGAKTTRGRFRKTASPSGRSRWFSSRVYFQGGEHWSLILLFGVVFLYWDLCLGLIGLGDCTGRLWSENPPITIMCCF